jgi:hypothetical protein
MAKKSQLRYIRGQVIVLPFSMMDCEAFQNLSSNAKALIPYFQRFWYSYKSTDMGIRQVAKYLNVCNGTAAKAIKELELENFIKVERNSYRDLARGINLTKSFLLNWMPYNNSRPTCEFLTEAELCNIRFNKIKYK